MNKILSPRPALLLLALAALAALSSAWLLEFGFGFAPCRLCIWQRWPYVAVLVLVAVALSVPLVEPARRWLLALAGAILALGAGIAFWHAGIEWGWFAPLANCAAGDFNMSDFSPNDLPPSVSCADAPFRMIGLSLAFYNGLFASLLGLFALMAVIRGRDTA